MATTLNAGTATGGAAISADTTGVLALQSGSTPTTAVTITATQNVGIGVTSPGNKVALPNNAFIAFQNTSAAETGYIGMTSGNLMSYSDKFYTDSSGNLLVGTTGIGVTTRFGVKGVDSSSSNWSMYAVNSASTVQFGLRNDNYFYAPSISTFAATGTAVVVTGSYLGYLSSSIRFKKDVVDYDKGIETVSKLRPVYYRSSKPNQDGEYDERTYAGFIAEEVKELGLEEFIDYDNEGKVTSLKYGQMTAILCKAIQELNAKVDAQAAEIQALKGVA